MHFTVKNRIIRERIAICEKCEHFGTFRRCNICGCFMDFKCAIMKEKCPIDKWMNHDESESNTNIS